MILPLSQIFLIAFGLSLDAVGVSVASGIKSKGFKFIHAVKVAAFFGVFQAVMPLIGFLIGVIMKDAITSIDHWIAFILLVIIGLKMLWEALGEGKKHKDIINIKILVLLSIATSIDALIIGITLPLLKAPILLSISIIGLVTFILSFLGFLFGKQLGVFFGKKIEILAGIVLIVIGLKILLEHL